MDKYSKLLIPDLNDPLAFLVFCLILALMLAAVVAGGVARLRHQRAAEQPTETSGRFEDQDARLRTLPDRFAEAAPPLLIMVGLLGTFVGLAAAIDQAQGALAEGGTASALTGKLSGMLGDIGLKFRSSAWGLIGFFLLRPAIHYLVTDHRHRVAANLDRRGRAAADASRTSREASEAKLWKERDGRLERIAESAAVLNSWGEVLTLLRENSIATASSASKMTRAAEALSNTVSVISSAVTDAVEQSAMATARAVQESSKVVSDGLTNVDAAIIGLQTSLSASLRESSEAMSGAMERSGRSMDAAVRGSAESMTSAAEALSKTVTDVSSAVTNAVKQSATTTAGAVQESSKAVGDGLTKVDAAIKGLQTSLSESLLKSSEVMSGAMDRSGRTMDAAVSKSATETTKAIVDSAASTAAVVAKLEAAVGRSGEATSQAIRGSAESMRKASEQLSLAVTQSAAAASEAMTKGSMSVQESIGKLDGVIDRIKTSLGQSLAANGQEITRAMGGITAQSRESVAELKSANQVSLARLVEAQGAGSEAVRLTLEQVGQVLSQLNEAVGDIRKISVETQATLKASLATNEQLKRGVVQLNKGLQLFNGDMAKSSASLSGAIKRLAAMQAPGPVHPLDGPPAGSLNPTGASDN